MKKDNRENTDLIDKVVSRNLKEQRLKLGISQKEIATVLGVSNQQVQKYENGINRISSGKLFKICNSFKIPMNSFFAKQAD